VVEALDLDGAIAVVNAKEPGYTTHARDTSQLRITGEERAEDWAVRCGSPSDRSR